MTHTETEYVDEPAPADEPADTFTPRPRRRQVTPVTAALAAVLVAGLGFIGGVLVQKHEGGSTGAGNGGQRAGAPGAPGAGGQAPGGPGAGQARPGAAGAPGGANGPQPTAGTVKTKSGNTLYVQDASGATVKVRLNGQSKVTRTATAGARRIHPGDTVVVQGAKSSKGTVTATSVSATQAGTSAGGGFGGGFPGPPGAAPGGGAGGAGPPQGGG